HRARRPRTVRDAACRWPSENPLGEALPDRPHDERLAPPRVDAREHAGHRRLVVRSGFQVAALGQLAAEPGDHGVQLRTEEPECQQHEFARQLELAARPLLHHGAAVHGRAYSPPRVRFRPDTLASRSSRDATTKSPSLSATGDCRDGAKSTRPRSSKTMLTNRLIERTRTL